MCHHLLVKFYVNLDRWPHERHDIQEHNQIKNNNNNKGIQ